jgi:hypothetical protein
MERTALPCPAFASLPNVGRIAWWMIWLPVGFVSSAVAAVPEVRFDTLPVVECRDVTTDEFATTNPNERLVQARLEISSLITQGDEENLLQFFYRITSPHRGLQVVDYQPRTTAASDYAGNIGVEKRNESSRSAGLAVTGAFDPLIKITGSGDLGSKNSSSVRYELVPPQESVAAAGTIARGHGVYFKLKRMRQALLEGAKEFVVTVRVPRSWRGDYVHVHCEAKGIQRGMFRQLDEEVVCGQGDFLVALCLAGDEPSKEAAGHFIESSRTLRQAAARYRGRIRKQQFPSMLHELGVVLGATRPKLSESWLSEVLYAPRSQQLQRLTSRLPDNVREVAVAYLAAREALWQSKPASDPIELTGPVGR